MKIVFNRQNVSDAVAPLMCAVSGKSTLTAAEGILIEANADGSCVMTTFDLEKGMRIKMEATVEEAGAAIINDWRDRTKVISCKTVEEGEVKPVVTAAGMTKTMAPRSEDSLEESYIERMDSDVHDYYRHFVNAIRTGCEQDVTYDHMRTDLKIILAAFRSAELGMPVGLE